MRLRRGDGSPVAGILKEEGRKQKGIQRRVQPGPPRPTAKRVAGPPPPRGPARRFQRVALNGRAPPHVLQPMRRTPDRAALTSDLALLAYLSAAKLVLHLLTNHAYGYFRDEL